MIELDIGTAKVYTTDNGNHSPEEWAEMAVDRIIFIGGNSHPVIVDQARAFREHIHATLTHYFKLALQAERAAIPRSM